MSLSLRATVSPLVLSRSTLREIIERTGAVCDLADEITYTGPACLHIGPSCFFMGALQCIYERLARVDPRWMLDVVSMRSRCTTDLLIRQNGLHCVTESCPEGNLMTRILGSIRDAYYAGPGCELSEFHEVLRRLDQAIVVSFTVTPSGWPKDLGNSDLLRDIGILTDFYFNEQPPGAMPHSRFTTVIGYIAWTLVERWRSGRAAPAFLMAENLKNGGPRAREVLLKFLDQIDNRVSGEIRDGKYPMYIPIVMGDRIVAEGQSRDAEGNRIPSRESERLYAEYGVGDSLALLCEQHLYLVSGVLDEKGNMLPGTEALRELQCGEMQFTTPERALKAQIEKLLYVNGAHTALALLGALLGVDFIDRVAATNLINDILIERNLEVQRVLHGKGVAELPEQYNGILLRRFANPRLADSVRRVGRRISSKVQAYFLETILLSIEQGSMAKASAKLVATWIYYLHLESENRLEVCLPDNEFIEEYGDWRNKVPAAIYLAATANPDKTRAAVLVAEVLTNRGEPIFPPSLRGNSEFLEVLTGTLIELSVTGIDSQYPPTERLT